VNERLGKAFVGELASAWLHLERAHVLSQETGRRPHLPARR